MEPKEEVKVNPVPENSPPVPKKQGVSRLLIVLSGLGLLLIVLVLAFLLTRQKAAPSKDVLTEIKEKTQAERKSSAVIVSDYLYSQKREDGYNNFLSHFEELCGGERASQCPFGSENVFEINNSWSALGYFGAYKITNEKRHLDQANKDLDLLFQYCNAKAEDCLWVLAQPLIISIDQDVNSHQDSLRKVGDLLTTQSNEKNVMLLSIESRELSLLYTLFKDEKYLTAAKERYQLAKDHYERGRSGTVQTRDTNPLQACWMTLAAAELARSTRDQVYVNEASLVQTDDFIRKMMYSNQFAVNIQPCAETYYILYTLSGETIYLQEGLRLLRYLETEFLDAPEKNLAWGEGGMLAVKPLVGSGTQSNKQVNLTDTSYMLYLLYLYNPE